MCKSNRPWNLFLDIALSHMWHFTPVSLVNNPLCPARFLPGCFQLDSAILTTSSYFPWLCTRLKFDRKEANKWVLCNNWKCVKQHKYLFFYNLKIPTTQWKHLLFLLSFHLNFTSFCIMRKNTEWIFGDNLDQLF